jgi:hypothetical protein
MSLLSLSPSPPPCPPSHEASEDGEERECSVGMVCTLLKQGVNEIARNGGVDGMYFFGLVPRVALILPAFAGGSGAASC